MSLVVHVLCSFELCYEICYKILILSSILLSITVRVLRLELICLLFFITFNEFFIILCQIEWTNILFILNVSSFFLFFSLFFLYDEFNNFKAKWSMFFSPNENNILNSENIVWVHNVLSPGNPKANRSNISCNFLLVLVVNWVALILQVFFLWVSLRKFKSLKKIRKK